MAATLLGKSPDEAEEVGYNGSNAKPQNCAALGLPCGRIPHPAHSAGSAGLRFSLESVARWAKRTM
jgi:hypothetical protein